MNLLQLRRFVVVAEELHFGRAAEKLHISQPPLSLSIQQLEKYLGVQLLNRDNKTVTLTRAGAAFYHDARRLLQQTEAMKERATRVEQGIEGCLKIGFIGSMLFRGLSQTVNEFQRNYPTIDIILSELNTTEQIQALQREQIDIAFTHTTGYLSEDFQSKVLLREPFVCCLPENHRLGQNKTIHLEALSAETFLIFNQSLSPHYHDLIVALCVTAGFSPKIRHEVRNWLTVITLVAHNMGIALVPSSMQKAPSCDVAFIPLVENPIYAETYCAWRKNEVSVTLERFIEFI